MKFKKFINFILYSIIKIIIIIVLLLTFGVIFYLFLLKFYFPTKFETNNIDALPAYVKYFINIHFEQPLEVRAYSSWDNGIALIRVKYHKEASMLQCEPQKIDSLNIEPEIIKWVLNEVPEEKRDIIKLKSWLCDSHDNFKTKHYFFLDESLKSAYLFKNPTGYVDSEPN